MPGKYKWYVSQKIKISYEKKLTPTNKAMDLIENYKTVYCEASNVIEGVRHADTATLTIRDEGST